jgi:hypothetical protein
VQKGTPESTTSQSMRLHRPIGTNQFVTEHLQSAATECGHFTAQRRLAQFATAVGLIITVTLVEWVKRWESMPVSYACGKASLIGYADR